MGHHRASAPPRSCPRDDAACLPGAVDGFARPVGGFAGRREQPDPEGRQAERSYATPRAGGRREVC